MRVLRVRPLPILLLLTGTLGCQRYAREPLDLSGHRAAFLARTIEGHEVRDFAASLAARATPSPSAFDPADGLSCAEAEALALVFNADLRLARARAGVAAATAHHAGLPDDPTIGVDVARVLQRTPEPWKVFGALGLTIPVSGRLAAEKRLVAQEHAVELTRVVDQEWRTRLEVRRAWARHAALAARLALTHDFVDRLDGVLAIVDRMEASGEMPRTEARLIRIERATQAAALDDLGSSVRAEFHGLIQLMGLAPDAGPTLTLDGLGGTGEASPDPKPEVIESRHPALAVAHAEYEAAERALALETRRQYPDLQIGPGFGRDEGQNQALLGLSLPLPILNANRGGIAQARAKRDLARMNAQVVLETLVAEARAARERLDSAGRRLEAIETRLVPLVDAQYTDARRIAELGEVSTLVLLESLTRQHDAKASLIDARLDLALARIDLDSFAGPEPQAPSTAPLAEPESGSAPGARP